MTGPKTPDRCPMQSVRSARRRPSISKRRRISGAAKGSSASAVGSEPASEPAFEPAGEAAPASPAGPPAPRPVSAWIVAPVSGAVAAALVIGVGWMLGWPPIQPPSAPPAPQLNAAAIDSLTARVAGLIEGRQARARCGCGRARRGAGKIGCDAARRIFRRARASRQAGVRRHGAKIGAAWRRHGVAGYRGDRRTHRQAGLIAQRPAVRLQPQPHCYQHKPSLLLSCQ